ncbi:isoleucine--tRNA ligase, partial [Candidatus Saccharibacteria bacterium]|nr:isoleucine--tRNA ligase [Candidatus Saccharibacteria bacterium]
MMKKIPNYQPEKLEDQIIKFWQDNQIFEKSLDKTKEGEVYSFYDGPPFANGLPHFGHNLVTAIKDAFGRYETMRGHYVPRRLGWDCHGLPVETKIEKELGVKNKRDIEERIGIAKFNQACRESVFKYKDQWERLFTRLGRWADSEDYYATLDDNYIESVWWVFSEAYKQGLVYQGQRPTGYCPRCATPLSNFELNQGYKENVKDPSLVVKFALKNQENTYFLVWTTTPWTLPGNLAIAISPSQTYFKVKLGDQLLILAEARLELLGKREYKVVDQYLGQDLIGEEYQPLYSAIGQLDSEQLKRVYRLYPGDFVSMEEGSGLVHIAPAFGEDDNALAKEYDLPVLISVDQHGMMADYTDFAGVFVKDADKLVIEELESRDLVFESKQIRHTYPFCWRCDSPLIYYVIDTWYIEVSKLREKLVRSNQDIRWIPEHFKEGRFGNWLAGARDWAISRNRYWGSPIPIWRSEESGEMIVVSSLEQLKELSIEPIGDLDLHRPGIDQIKLRTPSGAVATRVDEVFDCWFESGSMPYAAIHYPFENKELFEKSFPARFIAEGQDQTRGWFYTLHVLSAILYDRPAFENVVVNGLVLASDGKKLSKKLKNYNDPEKVINQFGADSLRFYLLSSAATNGQSIKFIEKDLATIKRNVMMTFYASASFLTLYAEIDQYNPTELRRPEGLISPLDNWIIARLDQTNQEIVQAMD